MGNRVWSLVNFWFGKNTLKFTKLHTLKIPNSLRFQFWHLLSLYEKTTFWRMTMWFPVEISYTWATWWENLFMPYTNNKGIDQPAHSRSLISAFVVCCLDSVIPLDSISKIWSLCLASVAAKAGLSLPWLQTPKIGFLVMRLTFAPPTGFARFKMNEIILRDWKTQN